MLAIFISQRFVAKMGDSSYAQRSRVGKGDLGMRSAWGPRCKTLFIPDSPRTGNSRSPSSLASLTVYAGCLDIIMNKTLSLSKNILLHRVHYLAILLMSRLYLTSFHSVPQ